MRKWPTIFSVLLLVSLVFLLPLSRVNFAMSHAAEAGIRKVLLETGVASEQTIEQEMERAQVEYKNRLSGGEKLEICVRTLVWWMLLVASVGLLLAKPWGYGMIYGATVINLLTAIPYVPFSYVLDGWFIVWFPFSQVINVVMVLFLGWSHLKMKRASGNLE